MHDDVYGLALNESDSDESSYSEEGPVYNETKASILRRFNEVIKYVITDCNEGEIPKPRWKMRRKGPISSSRICAGENTEACKIWKDSLADLTPTE